jgi:hypothetical protein
MKSLLAALLLITVVWPGMAFAQNTSDQEKLAAEAATAWLALCDADHYQESWGEASTFFRGVVPEADWTKALTALRRPLGALESRTRQSATSATSLPGVPDGHYVVMTFATAFANKKAATETVTFMLDTDGKWRAAGYFIK